MIRWAVLALACAFAPACGPAAAVWLRIEAPLAVPEECDALDVEVRRGRTDGDVSFQKTYDLSSGPAFPLTLSLTTDKAQDVGGEGFVIIATARKGESLSKTWSRGIERVNLE